MGMTIRGDAIALGIERSLGAADARRSQAIARLSSGLRLTTGTADGVDVGISQSLRSQIGGLQVAASNTQDAIGALSSIDATASSTQEVLARLRDLTVAAGNTGAQGPGALSSYRAERDQLLATLDQLAGASVGGHHTSDGTFQATFQVGANAGDVLRVNLPASLSSDGLGVGHLALGGRLGAVHTTSGLADFGGHPGTVSTWHLDVSGDAGVLALVAGLAHPATDVSVDGAVVDLSGVSTLAELAAAFGSSAPALTVTTDASGLTLSAGSTGPVALVVSGLGGVSTLGTADVPNSGGISAQAAAQVDWTNPAGVIAFSGGGSLDLATTATALQAAATTTQKAAVLTGLLDAAFTSASATVNPDGTFTVTADAHGTGTFTVTADGTAVSLDAIDRAVSALGRTRTQVGASVDALTATLGVTGAAVQALSGAQSHIQDVDVAGESLALTRASIVSSAASAMLAQATSAPARVLQLLLGG